MPPTFTTIPAKPPRRLMTPRRWAGVALLIIVVIAGLFIRDYTRVMNAYNAGHTAYLAANCDLALNEYRGINTENDTWIGEEIIATTKRELKECYAFHTAEYGKMELGSRESYPESESVIGFTQFLVDYPDTILTPRAQDKLIALYEDTPPEVLARSIELCQTVLTGGDDYIQVVERDTVLPALLLECGIMVHNRPIDQTEFCNNVTAVEVISAEDCPEDEKRLNRSVLAMQYLNAYDRRYPDDARNAEAETLMAEELNTQADLFNAGEIPQPEIANFNDSAKATLVIQNDAPGALQMAFNSEVFDLERCLDCVNFAVEPEACPAKGPVGTYELEPGVYNVVVSTANGSDYAIPFRGTWNLEAGTEYYSCFFIVRQSR